MQFQQATKGFLAFLQAHPEVRRQIRAAPNQTLLYAGSFLKPLWREIARDRLTRPELAHKETLHDVLARIPAHGTPHGSLLGYVQYIGERVPWQPDGFIIWRALSGIFASNAIGAVSFQVGSGVSAADKVFAATEVAVLLRNPRIDATTRDLLSYFQRAIRSGQTDINVGLIVG